MAEPTVGMEDSDDEAPVLINVDSEVKDRKTKSNDDADKIRTPSISPDAPLISPCPVTILSGFLGAGKTTLIQYILKSPDHGRRIAVIENEFGGGDDALSVETMIARDGANEASLSDLIELPNGCICCTVKDSLVTTLENLLEKRQDLDYILIEASGMANPGPIASLFWLDDALESRLRLDGVVTLVDAYHIARQLKETEEAAQQIAYADRILLNKVDLVDDLELERVVETIRSIHPTAPIRNTTYSKVPDLDWILDAACFDNDRAKEVDVVFGQLQQSVRTVSPHAMSGCSEPSCQQCTPETVLCVEIPSSEPHHIHTSAVGTVALVRSGSANLQRMNEWLASILWPNQDERDKVLRARLQRSSDASRDKLENTKPTDTMTIFRVKGILSVRRRLDDIEEDDHDYVDDNGIDIRRHIVQAVHDLWEIHPASSDLHWDRILPGENSLPSRVCKLVVIGRHLREEDLTHGFEACFDITDAYESYANLKY